MAFSAHTYVGDGTDAQLAVNFTLGFLSRDDVHAYVEGEGTERTITWINDGLITIGAVDAGLEILIRRETNKTVLAHDYSNGAVITEDHLDNSNLQNIMLVHEVLDGFREDEFEYKEDQDLGGNRIINLGAGVDDSDAATVAQLNDTLSSVAADVALVEAAVDDAEAQVVLAADQVVLAQAEVTNAAAQVTLASGHADDAETAQTAAELAQTNAETAQTGAELAETNALASEAAAAASYDDFDDRYLGPKATDPTLDNDGDALVVGALYFDTTASRMKVYDGAVWNALVVGGDADTLDGIDSSGFVQVGDTATELAAGIIELATTPEAQALTDDLRAITPAKLSAALQGSNQSLAASGFQKLPGGLILQWGVFPNYAQGSTNIVTLPLTYPNSGFVVVAGRTAHNNTGTTMSDFGAYFSSNSQITIKQGTNAGGIDDDAAGVYFTIGY